jgi:hypothetical protein
MTDASVHHPNKARLRTALTLCGCALASLVLAAGSYVLQPAISGTQVVSGKVLPEFAADMPQVRTITVQTAATSYSLVRQGSRWVMPERDNFPVSQAALSQLAKQLSDLSYVAARTSDPSAFARLGVDDPGPDSNGALVSIKGSTGQLLGSLHIGQKADAVFVRKAGSNAVFETTALKLEFAAPSNWLDFPTLDVLPENIASVTGQTASQPAYSIVRRPDGGFGPVGGVQNTAATACAIAMTNWAPIDVRAANGLTGDPVASHATTLKDGTVINVALYTQTDGNWAVVSADTTTGEATPKTTQINRRTDGWAFKLAGEQFDELTLSRRAIMGEQVP